MSWSDRFARMLSGPRQARSSGGAHVRESRSDQRPFVPAPRSGTTSMAATASSIPRLPGVVPASRLPTARVLVAARDDDVRFLLRRRCELSDVLEVVGEAKEPISCVRAAARLRPDLIVVQVRSSSDTEVELITACKELSPHSKVFAYSTLPGAAAVSAATAAGADRYALAGAPLASLLEEIEELAGARSAHGSKR